MTLYIFFKCPKGTECQEWPRYDHWMLGINASVQQTWAMKTYGIKDKCLFTVLPPLPMTLPAANDGTFMWASNLTSSFGPKKFSSFNFPKIRPWAWEKQQRESMNEYTIKWLYIHTMSKPIHKMSTFLPWTVPLVVQ